MSDQGTVYRCKAGKEFVDVAVDDDGRMTIVSHNLADPDGGMIEDQEEVRAFVDELRHGLQGRLSGADEWEWAVCDIMPCAAAGTAPTPDE